MSRLKERGGKHPSRGASSAVTESLVKKAMVVKRRFAMLSLVVLSVAALTVFAGVKRGWFVSTRAASPAPQSGLSLSKEYIYEGGRLLATEEPTGSGGCGSPPPTPGSISAAAQSTTSVLITWPPSSGADHYEVQRTTNITLPSGGWGLLSPNPTNNSFTDNSVAASTTYAYRVRAVDASGVCPSQFTSLDIATTILFTDDPLIQQSTIIKAVHISQLRQAVNAVRAAAGLSAALWTDNPLQTGSTRVNAQHVTELRTNLDLALTALGLSAGGYTDPTLAPGSSVVRAVHVEQLRQRVK